MVPEEEIENETQALLNLYSVYSNALTVNEVLQGLEEINATRMSVACCGWTQQNINFRQGRKCKSNPSIG